MRARHWVSVVTLKSELLSVTVIAVPCVAVPESNWWNGQPFMSIDLCRPHAGGTQWSMCVCLFNHCSHCLSHCNFHNMSKKMSNLLKCGLELKMNWFNWSILISSGFQFQFNSNSKSFNSIPIQFMLNWIELIINSNSIHQLIRALDPNDKNVSMVKIMAYKL